MLKWDKDSPVTFKADGHTVRDYEIRFSLEDQRKIPTDKKFLWKMIESNQFSIQRSCSDERNEGFYQF